MMKTQTKKLFTYLLLLIAAIPLIYLLIFKFQQQSIRHKMEERLESSVLHTICIPGNQVQWMKKGKEIKVDGKMFDIKSFHIQNGVYVFTGLYDDEETALRDKLQYEQEKNSQNSKQLTQLFQLLQSFYNDPQHDIFFPDAKSESDMTINNSAIITQFISIITPPPRA